MRGAGGGFVLEVWFWYALDWCFPGVCFEFVGVWGSDDDGWVLLDGVFLLVFRFRLFAWVLVYVASGVRVRYSARSCLMYFKW